MTVTWFEWKRTPERERFGQRIPTRALESRVFGKFGSGYAWAEITEEADGVAMYVRASGTAEPAVGTVGTDVFRVGDASPEQAIDVLRWMPEAKHFDRYQLPPIVVQHPSRPTCFCMWEGSLHCVFYKKGGYVPHFLPVTVETAKRMMRGEVELRYVIGGSGAFFRDVKTHEKIYR